MSKYAGKDVTFSIGNNPYAAAETGSIENAPVSLNPLTFEQDTPLPFDDQAILFLDGFNEDGYKSLNKRFFIATKIDTKMFSIPIDASGFAEYKSGGEFYVPDGLTEVGITDVSIDESADELDVTDTKSTAREYLVSANNKTITWAQWYDDTETTPMAVGNIRWFKLDAGTVEISGVEYDLYWIGTLVITGRKVAATMNDAVKYEFTARITGIMGFSPYS